MTSHPLRSRNWFGRTDLDGFVHRSWLKAEGFSDVVFDGRPVIGIANSWSELTNCNAHLRQVAEAVKRGVWCGRRLSAGVPHHLAGRSADEAHHDDVPQPDVDGRRGVHPRLPARRRRAPVRLRQDHAGHADGRRLRRHARGHGDRRADAERQVARPRSSAPAPTAGGSGPSGAPGRSPTRSSARPSRACRARAGHCMVMGTASTMASMAEALGMTLPGNAAIPAADSRRLAMAEMAGRRAVEMALAGGPKPRADPHRAGVRQRDPRDYGDRRLDQRDHPPARAGRSRRRAAAARALRRALADHAVPAQPAPVRQVSDGGLLLRGRSAGRAQGAPAAAARRRPHRERPHDSPTTSATPRAGTRTSSARSPCRWRPRAAVAI